MESKAVHQAHPEGFAELGIVTHEGREFASGGAYVDDQQIVCYPKGETVGAEVGDRQGNTIGQILAVSSRKAVFFGYPSWQGSRYYYMRVQLTDGRRYAVRGFGAGMIAQGKRIK